MQNLPPAIEAVVVAHAERGRAARERGDLAAAEAAWLAAWSAIPEPRFSFDFHPQVISRGLVDLYSQLGEVEKARAWLEIVRKAYGWDEPGGPSVAAQELIQFLEGQLALDAGELDRAFEIFDAAYRQHGRRAFAGDRQRFLTFLERRRKAHPEDASG